MSIENKRPKTFASCLLAVAAILDEVDDIDDNYEHEVQNDLRIWAKWFARQPNIDKLLMSLEGLSSTNAET